MPRCLIAIGSNLGDRAGALQAVVRELDALPNTRVVARSRWHETTPRGGPAGQGPFLNGSVLAGTTLAPEELLRECQQIERKAGRQRRERWAARSLDIDLLLYDTVVLCTDRLELPHPRMAFRRFALAPAAEVAPWMVHAESGWIVADLLRNLHQPVEVFAVAAGAPARADEFAALLARRLVLPLASAAGDTFRGACVRPWAPADAGAPAHGRAMILALAGSCGIDARQMRRMLHLPERGPVAWIADRGADDPLGQAVAAIQSAYPKLVAQLPAGTA